MRPFQHTRTPLRAALALILGLVAGACVPAGTTQESTDGMYTYSDTARGIRCYSTGSDTLQCLRVRPETVFVRVVTPTPELAPKQ